MTAPKSGKKLDLKIKRVLKTSVRGGIAGASVAGPVSDDGLASRIASWVAPPLPPNDWEGLPGPASKTAASKAKSR